MNSLERRIQAIEERNKRVEADKAWETSLTRRVSIAVITYFFALGFLFAINRQYNKLFRPCVCVEDRCDNGLSV